MRLGAAPAKMAKGTWPLGQLDLCEAIVLNGCQSMGRQKGKSSRESEQMSRLTRLEQSVLNLRARGLTVKEASSHLDHSPYSVKRALERIYRKTSAHSTLQALHALGTVRL